MSIPLDVLVKTPHGEPVTGAQVMLMGGGVVRRGVEVRPGEYQLLLSAAGDYQLQVSRFGTAGGFDHKTLRQTLFLMLTQDRPALRLLKPPDQVRSKVRTWRKGAGFRVRVQLDYLWFTPIGTAPTQGNDVVLYRDGEDGWAAVAHAIKQARESVHLTTWIYEGSTELLRPDPMASPRTRLQNTVQELLAERAHAGATVRLLLWDAPVIRMPKEAREAARDPHDNFEVMEQENPTKRHVFNEEGLGLLNMVVGKWKIGSYHQKTVIVDDQVAFCGGMNLKENDWDTRIHTLFDPRRAKFSRATTFRQEVLNAIRPSDHRPRHDFVAKVLGPAVEHLQQNFQQRWNHLIESEAGHSDGASPVVQTHPVAPTGTSQVQVVRTMPEPFSERGILDVHLRALQTARRLIFIEDQYFRSTHVSDAIAAAVRKFPELVVIVVTQQAYAEDIVGGGWTQECFERIRRRAPDLTLFTLRSWAVDRDGEHHLEEIDNHSKLMIVDDLFMTVGSCNINDRGFEYEGEINIAMVDAPKVKQMRVDVWQDLLGEGVKLTGDIEQDVQVWREVSAHNAAFEAGDRERPMGLVFPFVPRTERKMVAGRDVT